MNLARSMLSDAQLPAHYWGEAMSTAVHVLDLIPVTRHPGKAPFEIRTGQKPDVSYLHPFGCTAYTKIPKEDGASKLDPRSVKGVLVGYFRKGDYKILERMTGRMFHARDVIFKEGTGHRSITILTIPEEDHQPTVIANGQMPPDVLSTQQPVALRIRPGSRPLHLDPVATINAHTENSATNLLPMLPAQLQPMQTLRCSSQLAQPSPALIAMWDPIQRETTAHDQGEDWMGGDFSTALMTRGPFTFIADRGNKDIPKTYVETMRRLDLWQAPMNEELKMMEDRGIFELVDEKSVPRDKNMVGCRWVYANKHNAEGDVIRRKACLVAKGFSQVAGEDFDKTYAAVVQLKSLHMSAAIAAQEGLEIWQVDFISAYLNSIPEHKVYIHLPPVFPGGEGKLV